MKRALILIIIISLILISGCANSNITRGSANKNSNNTADNAFFFKSNVSQINYHGKFLFYEDAEKEVKLHINEVANLKDGKLYELKLDPINGIPNDRLNLGYFYVQKDKVYKIEPTKENLNKLTANEVLNESIIVCQDEELKDPISQDKPGFHQYIKVNGDKRESHTYNDNVSTGYYESFVWEKNKGLINYRSGYAAERDSIELQLSSISESALASFFGEWKTTKRLIIPRVYSNEELKRNNIVGDNIVIKSNIFSIASIRYKNPYYKVSNITNDEFGDDTINTFYNSSLSKLNIYDRSTITQLDVFSDKSSNFPIITLYFDDNNTIIANANYSAMYELKRVRK